MSESNLHVIWTGFNFQWLFSWEPGKKPADPDLKALDFLAKHGFDFARLACDYRFWTDPTDYEIIDPSVLDHLERCVLACKERGIHCSLNMHRVPGYCINRPEIERHNLWTDKPAQDGFAFQWQHFAARFRGHRPEDLSFDLVNEPPDIGQYGMTRAIHEALIRRVVQEIRDVDPDRTIVIDGL